MFSNTPVCTTSTVTSPAETGVNSARLCDRMEVKETGVSTSSGTITRPYGRGDEGTKTAGDGSEASTTSSPGPAGAALTGFASTGDGSTVTRIGPAKLSNSSPSGTAEKRLTQTAIW